MADNERKSYSRLAQAPAEKPLPDIQKKPLPTVHAFEADEKLHGHDMNRLHWKVPTLLACSLLAGAVFAVTHHLFYRPKEDLIPLGAAFDYDPYNGLDLPQKYNEVISYLSVMYSFGSIVTGSVTSLAQTGTPIVQSTIIQSTQLAPYASPTIPDATPDNATVRAAFEELFQNITFSLFSSNNYLLNASDPAQARDVQTPTITSSRFANKYTYNAYSLWLAYGLALAGEVTCLTIGFFALYSNRVAFTNGFSTILRATRNKELGQLVAGDEFNGADPVPEDVLDAMISYRLGDGQTAGFGISSHRVAR